MTDIPAGHDYQGVAICKSDDPGWQLPDWDALTDELLPQTHVVKVDEILVAGDADRAIQPNAIYCTQGLRSVTVGSVAGRAIPFRVAPRYQGAGSEAAPADPPELPSSSAANRQEATRRIDIGVIDTGIAQVVIGRSLWTAKCQARDGVRSRGAKRRW